MCEHSFLDVVRCGSLWRWVRTQSSPCHPHPSLRDTFSQDPGEGLFLISLIPLYFMFAATQERLPPGGSCRSLGVTEGERATSGEISRRGCAISKFYGFHHWLSLDIISSDLKSRGLLPPLPWSPSLPEGGCFDCANIAFLMAFGGGSLWGMCEHCGSVSSPHPSAQRAATFPAGEGFFECAYIAF